MICVSLVLIWVVYLGLSWSTCVLVLLVCLLRVYGWTLVVNAVFELACDALFVRFLS